MRIRPLSPLNHRGSGLPSGATSSPARIIASFQMLSVIWCAVTCFPCVRQPVLEMTPTERDAYTTSLRRALRDDEVRRGRRPPRSMRETEIWRQALPVGRKRDDRTDRPPRQLGTQYVMPMSDVTPEEIAQWMADRLEQQGSLDQADAVDEIAKRFGEQFTYLNDSGNPAIDRRVLRAFKKVTGDTVVWERWDFCWRKRSEGDAAGRKQE